MPETKWTVTKKVSGRMLFLFLFPTRCGNHVYTTLREYTNTTITTKIFSYHFCNYCYSKYYCYRFFITHIHVNRIEWEFKLLVFILFQFITSLKNCEMPRKFMWLFVIRNFVIHRRWKWPCVDCIEHGFAIWADIYLGFKRSHSSCDDKEGCQRSTNVCFCFCSCI